MKSKDELGVSYDVKKLEGKTIKEVEVIKAEFGRTFPSYICFTCEDNTRVLVGAVNMFFDPEPDLSTMEKSKFFTEKDTIKKRDEDIRKREEETKKSKEIRREEYERLKKEFEE